MIFPLPLSGKSVAQVALRWLLQKEIVSSVIIGAKTVQQLEDNMGAASGWELSQTQVDNANSEANYQPFSLCVISA